jgi:hypothetical protein
VCLDDLREAISSPVGNARGARPRKFDAADDIPAVKRMKADGHTGEDIAKCRAVSRATLSGYFSPDSAA